MSANVPAGARRVAMSAQPPVMRRFRAIITGGFIDTVVKSCDNCGNYDICDCINGECIGYDNIPKKWVEK